MRWVLGVLAAWLMVGAVPASADTVTLYDEGGWSGTGIPPKTTVYDTAAGDPITVEARDGGIRVNARVLNDFMSSVGLEFHGPGVAGELRPGVYPDADYAWRRQADRAGLFVQAGYIYGQCSKYRGSLEVRELVRDGTGKVTRAWIVFEQHCEGVVTSLFGEVRIGMPDGAAPHTAPAQVRWPEDEVGGRSLPVPVHVRGTAIEDVRVIGEDFKIVGHDCEGAAQCIVSVVAEPKAAGARSAALRVIDASGATDVPLEVDARGGETGYRMVSEPGEWVGDGRTWVYDPATDIRLGGSRAGISGSVLDPDGGRWTVAFEAHDGDILTAGTTYTATSREGGAPYIDVAGMGRGCGYWRGTFTVHEIAFDENDLRRLKLTYEIDCFIDPGKFLRGTLNWHAGDATPPAPWMVPSAPSVPEAPAPAVSASLTASYQGGPRHVFDRAAGDAVVADVSGGGGLSIRATGGTFGKPVVLRFYTPGLERGVKPGVYRGAAILGAGDFRPEEPGIFVEFEGVGWSGDGSFEVREFSVTPAGEVVRAWILWESRNSERSASGELRIGAAAGDAPRTVPERLRWPVGELGEGGHTLPVSVWAKAQVTDVRVVGANVDEVAIRHDDCTGVAVERGRPCDVWLRFTPRAAGLRTAMVRVTDAAGRTTDVALESFAHGGTTRYLMISEPGEFVGRGLTWDYGPTSDLEIGATLDRKRIAISIIGAFTGDMWRVELAPPPGGTLGVGHYPDARYYRDAGQHPGLGVSGAARGCSDVTGEFTIHQLEFVGREITRARVSFVMHCQGATPALRGTFSWHADDTTPLAPWMIPTTPGGPTPTPTPTATPTPTPTPTPTATPSPTPTATPTPDADADGHADADPDGHADADPDGHADADPDGHADADPDGHADADPDGHADADRHTDALAGRNRDPDGHTRVAARRAVAVRGTRRPHAATRVKAATARCTDAARALSRAPADRRRALARRFLTRARTCRIAVTKLPASSERTAALAALRDHTAAARILQRRTPSARDVRRARTVLRARR